MIPIGDATLHVTIGLNETARFVFARYAQIPWSGGFMLPYGNFFVRSRFTVASAGARSAVLRFLGKPKRFLKERDFGESGVVVWGVVAARRGGGRCAPTGGEIFGATPCITATFASAARGFGGLGRGGVLDLTETVRILTRGRIG